MKATSYIISKVLSGYHYLLLNIFRNNFGFLRSLARTIPFPEVRKKAWLLSGTKVGDGACINHSIAVLYSKDTTIIKERVACPLNVTIMNLILFYRVRALFVGGNFLIDSFSILVISSIVGIVWAMKINK